MFFVAAMAVGTRDCPAQATPADARTLREFHLDLMANVRAAEIARGRARAQFVRRVADDAARTLRQTRFNIESAARQNRIQLNTGISGQGRTLVNRISGAPASTFDRVYLDNTGHQMQRLQRMAQNGSRLANSASLRNAYRRSIPVFNRIAADVRTARARL